MERPGCICASLVGKGLTDCLERVEWNTGMTCARARLGLEAVKFASGNL